MTPLARLIRQRIAARGPMPVAEFMALCQGHPTLGYYATRDPLGAAGDFTTAPEISQMFGELIGAWLAQVWADQGRPVPFALAELGPGRGTLMRDALRAARGMAGFREAAELWLVETSPVLRARQAETLAGHAPRWAIAASQLPDLPLMLVANEFFDALPVRQFQRVDALWRERQVGLKGDAFGFVWGAARGDTALDAAHPGVPDGATVELGEAAAAVAAALAARIARHGGAALIIDYGGWDGTGDTLQALARHNPADPLARPGEADLTAHVRFRPLAEAAAGLGAHGPVAQGVFLERLGIAARLEALAQGRDEMARAAIIAAHRRLTHPDEMGQLFQVLALMPPDALPPPGFAP